MNRFKKELHKRGIKLESDYPTMPHPVKGKSPFEPGYIAIEAISVDSQTATVTSYYNVIVETLRMKRNGNLESV